MKKLEIRNYKVFPSREWGPEGGSSCDIYVDGNYEGYYFNAGDGGEPDIRISDELDKACSDMIKKKYPIVHEEEHDVLSGIECVLDLIDMLNKAKEKLKDIKKDCVIWLFNGGGWHDYQQYDKNFPEDSVRKHYAHLYNKSKFNFTTLKIESKKQLEKLMNFEIEV